MTQTAPYPRRFSGIFLKLFLGLWTLILVIVLSVWLASSNYRTTFEQGFQRIDWSRPAERAVGTAIGIAEWGGQEVLQKWLLDKQRNVRPTVFVIDGLGREITNREIPLRARQELADPRVLAQTAIIVTPHGLLRFFAVRMDKPRTSFLIGLWRTPPWILLTLALFATVFVSALLSWNIARPIRKLDWAMRRATEGALDVRIANTVGHNYDEIGDLAKRYDAMLEKINGLMSRQKRLFHDVSHELRSPLARIDVALALIEKNPQNAAEAVKRIESEVGRLDKLVEALLTYARLDENAPIDFEKTDLVAILEAICEDATFEGSAKGVDVKLEAPKEVFVLGNVDMLASAIENLVRNALRYSPKGSAVRVKAETIGNRIHLRITDAGPGIDPAELEKLFEPFVRGSSEATGSGFGLGLAIAKRAIERHGGILRAENNTPEVGLSMLIELPLLLNTTKKA